MNVVDIKCDVSVSIYNHPHHLRPIPRGLVLSRGIVTFVSLRQKTCAPSFVARLDIAFK